MVGGIRAPDRACGTPMTPDSPVRLAVHAMATRFEIYLPGEDTARLRSAGEEALREIEALELQLSRYRSESDIYRTNARAYREPVRLEARLFALLKRAAELSRLTDGAFDITVTPLLRAWGLDGGGKIPEPSELEAAHARVGISAMHLCGSDSTVRFEREWMEIDLGAIGKGYAIERAVEVIRECGVTSALIHGGTSTIYALGAPPDADAWRVAIDDPTNGGTLPDALDLRDCSLSVSAVHGKSFTREGKRYGHVIDPRTGAPTEGALLAAVWGPSPTDTDALSTALLVLGEPGLELLRDRMPDYEGLVLG